MQASLDVPRAATGVLNIITVYHDTVPRQRASSFPRTRPAVISGGGPFGAGAGAGAVGCSWARGGTPLSPAALRVSRQYCPIDCPVHRVDGRNFFSESHFRSDKFNDVPLWTEKKSDR